MNVYLYIWYSKKSVDVFTSLITILKNKKTNYEMWCIVDRGWKVFGINCTWYTFEKVCLMTVCVDKQINFQQMKLGHNEYKLLW